MLAVLGEYRRSLSARRAWIEMLLSASYARLGEVALRKESVDRNHVVLVAPAGCWLSLSARRAWIEIAKSTPEEAKRWSLSARRAWIEMAVLQLIPLSDPVALRKESVDRNKTFPGLLIGCIKSLSARRAWIEIPKIL